LAARATKSSITPTTATTTSSKISQFVGVAMSGPFF
jgi:hypothetical protein